MGAGEREGEDDEDEEALWLLVLLFPVLSRVCERKEGG